jgi:hypothetical protein
MVLPLLSLPALLFRTRLEQFACCARAEKHVFGSLQLDESVLAVECRGLLIDRRDSDDRTPNSVAHLQQFRQRGNQ